MLKPIALYLPQFHKIPENDKAWGTGFTEWTNVKKAQPLFEGHYQPHVPSNSLGYYDLNDPEVLVKQASLAKEYGIHGFAFYHYWFNGKLLLNTPIDNMLNTGSPDTPFMLIWANENWTKKWDGLDQEVIIKQEYSLEDDRDHIKYLFKFFNDKRYIKINNKPVFGVYRTELFPDIKETATIWREEARKAGFDDIYLFRVESVQNNINPASINFNAAMEFAPDWKAAESYVEKNGKKFPVKFAYDYSATVTNMICKPAPEHTLFRSVFASWDNTARQGNEGTVFMNSSEALFEYFTTRMIDYTRNHLKEYEQFIFINAWNEWGEGCHLEPDEKNGLKFLEIIRNCINNYDNNKSTEFAPYLFNLESKNYRQISELRILRKESDSLKKELNLIKNGSRAYRISKFIGLLYHLKFKQAFK